MNNGSVSGFVRNRYPIRPGNIAGQIYRDRTEAGNLLKEVNKRAKNAALKAYAFVQSLLARNGIHPGDPIVGTRGDTLQAYLLAAGIAKKHGFKLFGPPSYKHIHPTKGFRKVPA